MTVTQHTVADLFVLLVAAFLCGVLISCLYIVLLNLQKLVQACASPRFPTYHCFRDVLSYDSESKILKITSDFLICILVSIGIAVVLFLFNNGNFRFSAVVTMLLGFAAGYCLLVKIIQRITVYLLFLIKWVVNVFSYPLIWTARIIYRLFVAVFRYIIARRTAKLLEKHTKYRLSRIATDTEYGLIDKYYKELIK